MPTALERLTQAAVEAQYPEDSVEQLKRQLADLLAEIHTSNGALSSKIDGLVSEQRDMALSLAVLEEREKACAGTNTDVHKALWKSIDGVKKDAKAAAAEDKTGKRSLIAAVVAGIFAVGSAALALFK